jgi:ketoreductase
MIAREITLQNSVALVTGGGTGIGKAIARALAEKGARVAIASRNPSNLEATTNEFRAAGLSALPLRVDVKKKDEIEAAVARVRESWGGIDILVNNAGVSGLNRMDDPDDRRWSEIIETNLTGAYLVTKVALQAMNGRKGGRIINISSVLGKFGVPGYSAYCASKHGLIGFTKALALELVGRDITVNAICPGWVETEMARQGIRETAAQEGMSAEEFQKAAIGRVPLGRFIGLEEVAGLALYLASPQAAGITGQAINVCGGQTMV